MARWGEVRSWVHAAANYTGDDCLLWPFSTNRGYGVAWSGKRTLQASRYVCELAHGKPFLIWNDAAHRCGNRLCCNPKHLRWTTRAENEADKKRHGTSNRGERHGMSKLSARDVLAIRRLRKDGARRTDLAARFNVTPAAIYEITSGRRWGWLTGDKA